MKEEELLRQAFGKKHPFSVPDGYWDSLSGRVADIVAAHDVLPAARRSTVKRLWISACAACICGVLCISSICYMSRNAGTVASVTVNEAQGSYNEDTYMDEMADFAMLDNQDFYSYLSGE